MPAIDLADYSSTLGRFDVVGERSKTTPDFVRHVALLDSDESEISGGDTVRVVHMGPPLEMGAQFCVDVAGRIPLTPDEINTIKTWIATVEAEYRSQFAHKLDQYVIDPPWSDFRDKNTGMRRFRRYSCAGFVLDAHAQVDVQLLVIDTNELPEVSSETVKTAYPEASSHPVLLAKWGLKGDGPWRIVLAGYVLHALDRSSDEIRAEPYLAQAGDELF